MIALTHINLYDGIYPGIIRNAALLYDGSTILAAGKDVEIPSQATVIDLKGKTVIPGLIEAHTHFSGSSTFDYPGVANRIQSYNFTEFREGCMRWGVSAARSCGQFWEEALIFRDEVNSGKIPRCPRLILSGPMFQAPGGHPGYTVMLGNPNFEDIRRDGFVEVTDQTDLEGIIAESKEKGADFVKVFCAHLNKLDSHHFVPRITPDQIHRIITAAHENGMKVAVHVDNPEEMQEAALAGADFIEHIMGVGEPETDLPNDLISILKERGAVVDPTMISILRFDPLDDLPPVWEALKTAVNKLYQAGIPLLAGCDSGIPFVPFGESLHDELQCLNEAGIPPLELLRMATSGNATLLGVDDRLGTLQPGKDADFLVLNSDPTEDIANTKDICMFVLNGQIVTQLN